MLALEFVRALYTLLDEIDIDVLNGSYYSSRLSFLHQEPLMPSYVTELTHRERAHTKAR